MKVKLTIHKRYKTTICRVDAINYSCNKENSLNQVQEN